VDLAGIIQGLLDLLKASISKHVDLLVDFRKPLPRVTCNLAQISQLVMNLVINASQAIGDKEGVIKVCLSPAPEMQDSTLQGGGSLAEFIRLEVSDTGCGITEADQAKIFDPFFTTKPGGHGLGLAVVHGIVNSLRGTIRVASSRERGTTFEVVLPCDQAGAEVASFIDSGASAEDICLTPKTVLIVEDQEDLRLANAKALRRRGFSVFTADEGPAAVEVFHAHAEDIDVVLLDSNLPGFSGREVLTRIRAIKPGVRVILCSAYPPELAVSATSGEQPSGFLRKPYRFADLVRALQEPESKTSQAIAVLKSESAG
jgi:CheY-like chemotaxis protein